MHSHTSAHSFTGCLWGNESTLKSCCWCTSHSTHRLAPPYLSDDCQLIMDVGRRHLHISSCPHMYGPPSSQDSAIEVLGSPDHGCGTVCQLNCDSKTFASPSLGGYLRHFCSLILGALWLLCFNGAGYKHSYLLSYLHTTRLMASAHSTPRLFWIELHTAQTHVIYQVRLPRWFTVKNRQQCCFMLAILSAWKTLKISETCCPLPVKCWYASARVRCVWRSLDQLLPADILNTDNDCSRCHWNTGCLL